MNKKIKKVILNHKNYSETEYDLDKYDLNEYLERELDKTNKKPSLNKLDINIIDVKEKNRSKIFKVEIEKDKVVYIKREDIMNKYTWKVKNKYSKYF